MTESFPWVLKFATSHLRFDLPLDITVLIHPLLHHWNCGPDHLVHLVCIVLQLLSAIFTNIHQFGPTFYYWMSQLNSWTSLACIEHQNNYLHPQNSHLIWIWIECWRSHSQLSENSNSETNCVYLYSDCPELNRLLCEGFLSLTSLLRPLEPLDGATAAPGAATQNKDFFDE